MEIRAGGRTDNLRKGQVWDERAGGRLVPPVAFPRAIEHSPNAAFLFGQDGGTKADLAEECDEAEEACRKSKKIRGYLIL